MTTLYALLDTAGNIETFFGPTPQDKDIYPDLIELKSGDDTYKKYHAKMVSMAIADGMVLPGE